MLKLAAAVSLTGLMAVIVYYRLPDYSNVTQEQKRLIGTAVLDRNGAILRLFPDGKGRIGLWRQGDSFPKHLKAAVIAAEDQRFYYHLGFDPIAIVRAAYTNVREARRVSGASTITQQVVRLIRPRTTHVQIQDRGTPMRHEDGAPAL